MDVAFDARTTDDAAGSGLTSLNSSLLTIGSGPNRALVVQINFSLKTVSGLTVKWDATGANQSLTQIIAANSDGAQGRSELWGLVNPVSGNKELSLAWTGSSEAVVAAVAWTNVKQSGGAATFANATSNKGANNTPSVAVTSKAGNATMDVSTSNFGAYSAPTQTEVYTREFLPVIDGAGSRAAGAASVTHQWTLSGTPGNWVSVGVDIVAVDGITGSLSAALGNTTLAASGSVGGDIAGTLSTTLGNVTLTASGTVTTDVSTAAFGSHGLSFDALLVPDLEMGVSIASSDLEMVALLVHGIEVDVSVRTLSTPDVEEMEMSAALVPDLDLAAVPELWDFKAAVS